MKYILLALLALCSMQTIAQDKFPETALVEACSNKLDTIPRERIPAAINKLKPLAGKNLDATLQLGWLSRNIDQFSQSNQYYTQVLNMVDKKRDINYYIIAMLEMGSNNYRLRKYKKCEQILIVVDKEFPNRSLAMYYLGLALCMQKRYDEGIKRLESIYRQKKMEEAGILLTLNYIYGEKGDYKMAIKYGEIALKKTDDYILRGSVLNNIGYSKAMLGDVKGGMEMIEESLKVYPRNSYAYLNRGRIYLKLNKKKEACKEFALADANNVVPGFSTNFIPAGTCR
ncbi:tetratricopeptide repeat protein [Chitinophaga skermanii]|uniref:Tetratricopeptide repeat protein n=1 Tax=Chitinophaga skermanii TaxID=331697 RepID=A0A327R577_9BACT|nr:tetratricopeptide repeat protein [Chitinophaga skermanii]RAJ11112.1 tetratricopeptide repeat protein [Chitinophaga skermanii]